MRRVSLSHTYTDTDAQHNEQGVSRYYHLHVLPFKLNSYKLAKFLQFGIFLVPFSQEDLDQLDTYFR